MKTKTIFLVTLAAVIFAGVLGVIIRITVKDQVVRIGSQLQPLRPQFRGGMDVRPESAQEKLTREQERIQEFERRDAEELQQRISKRIKYIRDPRSDLCFAYFENSVNGGYAPVLATVPCEAVQKLLAPSQQSELGNSKPSQHVP